MKRLYAFFLLLLLLAVQQQSSAQGKILLLFPETPCDSISCLAFPIINPDTTARQVTQVWITDSTSFSTPYAVSTDTIGRGDTLRFPICFHPTMRGAISDSLYIVVAHATGADTLKIRLAGDGIAPALELIPSVINFPRTASGGASNRTIFIKNSGERPITFAAGALSFPAPFRLVTPLPITIPAGDSVQITIAFEPKQSGVYSESVLIPSGCGIQIQFGMNGSTNIIGTGAVLRPSKSGLNEANLESVPCGGLRCVNLTLSNVGNAPLNMEQLRWVLGNAGYFIDTTVTPITLPFLIPENGQRIVKVCVEANTTGTIRDTLLMQSNTRTSIAFGLVIDVSRSMEDPMRCGSTTTKRVEQARLQAMNFLSNTLLYLPGLGIQDQIAISRYSGTDAFPFIDHFFSLRNVTDAVRTAAVNAVSTTILNTISGTQTGRAVMRMLDTLAKSPLPNKVLVLLTDGQADAADRANFSVPSIVSAANAAGVQVFTIGIGIAAFPRPQDRADFRKYLGDMAQQTGGETFEAEDCDSLQFAFEKITDIVSRGNQVREPFAIRITSPRVEADRDLVFDSTYVYAEGTADTICQTITLTNVGEGEALVDSIEFTDMLGNPTNEFFLKPNSTFPVQVRQNRQVDVEICFTPKALRGRGGKVRFGYNNCGGQPIFRALAGTGYGRANLRITDERIGAIDQQVTLPIYGDTALQFYQVRTITYSLRWNRTMLDLVGVRPGMSAGAATVAITQPVTYQGSYATVGITVTGSALPTAGELALLDFNILRGDTLATLVELTAGQFDDGNPKMLLKNAGTVILDSTCFRSFKPVQAGGGVTKISVGQPLPNPAVDDAITLPVESSAASALFVEIFNTGGATVGPTTRHTLPAGNSTLTLDVRQLPPGSYYLTTRTPAGEIAMRKFVVGRN
ncbi:MAG: choice-of-anchor D domain-containing protein [Chlorobi bacterium]|nr:choice-of-anchor D domain-containing protein [Chlorobiota bacterium]MBX7216193.1 choice-of-anchor D domain-containing protein [Candidatus Kapabacteria bacterium]